MISGGVVEKYRYQALDWGQPVACESQFLGLEYFKVSEVGQSELEMYVSSPYGGMAWQTLSW